MDPATELISVSAAAAPATQQRLRLPELDTDDLWAIVDSRGELPDNVQQRMRIIQQLLAARGTKTYTQVQRQAASSLGISVRSLRRLVKAWQELGLKSTLGAAQFIEFCDRMLRRFSGSDLWGGEGID